MHRQAQCLDVANLEAAARQYQCCIEYLSLRHYLAAERECRECFVYVPINPWKPDSRAPLIRFLTQHGFFERTKIGQRRSDGYKCDMDVDLACDLLRLIWSGSVDIVTVASGDGDFEPIYREARQRGIRVEVASTPETVSWQVLNVASAFIDLSDVMLNEWGGVKPAVGNGEAA